MKKTFLVGGMMCENCAAAVTKAISAVHGVSSVKVDLAGKCAEVDYDGTASDKEIMDAIEDMGYDANGVKA